MGQWDQRWILRKSEGGGVMIRWTLDEWIDQQEQVVSRIKDRYDAEVSKLEKMMNKRDELRKKELMKAIKDSGKRFKEIIKFLQEDSAEGDALDVEIES